MVNMNYDSITDENLLVLKHSDSNVTTELNDNKNNLDQSPS